MRKKILSIILLIGLVVFLGCIPFVSKPLPAASEGPKQTTTENGTTEKNKAKTKTSAEKKTAQAGDGDIRENAGKTDSGTTDTTEVTIQNTDAKSADTQNTTQAVTTPATESTPDVSQPAMSKEEYASLLAIQEQEISGIETTVNAQNQQLLAAGGTPLTYDGGKFCLPIPLSFSKITSDFGYRLHPISQVEQLHNGIDYAAPATTPIYAAYSGQVAGCGLSPIMGNYVVLHHGDGLYSIYMHASAIYVSAGQTVASGQAIASVGSTGLSTGNHLHFSVRQNGIYVNPHTYLGY